MLLKKLVSLILPGILVLSFGFQSNALAARDQALQVKGTGSYTLGTMNLTIDSDTLNTILAEGGDAGNYQGGYNDNGQLLYMSTLLKNPGDAFTFDVAVPNDAATYGTVAGQTLTFTGIVFYPTTSSNSRSNYTIFGETIPHMQSAGEAPIFADAATKYPLVMYAHGSGDRADRQENLDIATKIASHGYIVVSLFHGDNRFETLSAERFTLRPLAVKNAIDAITTHAAFKDHIDLARIGGIGGSYGGATMLALIGGKVVYPNVLTTFDFTPKSTTTDSRIKAAAGLFPYMGNSFYSFFGTGGSGASGVTTPYMAISGTADTTAPITNVRDTMNQLAGTRYLIELEGEEHQFSATGLDEALTWAITYLDAFVKDEVATAHDTLLTASSVSGGVNDSVTVVTDSATDNPAPASGNSFVGTTGLLTLAAVDVPGAGVFSVTMTLTDSVNLEFTLSTVLTTTSSSNSSFSSSTGLLSIPTLDIDLGSGTQAWSADLQLVPGSDPLRFKVTQATPK